MHLGVRAQESSLNDIFAPGEKLRMPPYQRSYSWGETEALELLGDLQEANEAQIPHFIGAVVFVHGDEAGVLEIVDGQQRLTTLTILLCVLRDLETDKARAAAIAEALGRVDVGQGCVVVQGLCLATETLTGTDAMLASLSAIPDTLRPNPKQGRGLLYKAPKPTQDRRIDLPTIGPATVHAVARAGLGGIVWQAGGVICLDRSEMIAAADTAGLFLWARE